MISKLRLAGAAAAIFVVVPVLLADCGGDNAQAPATTTPTASAPATTSAAPSASVAASTPAIRCPSPSAAPVTPASPPKAGCPDMSTLDALAKLDMSKELKLDKKLGTQLKDIALATVALDHASAQIDGSMKEACGKLLADFGCSGDFGDAPATCHAAENVIDQARANAGPAATLTPRVTPAVCKVPAQAMLDCVHACDPTFKGKADALKCDGTADATGCDGSWSSAKTSQGCSIACAATAADKAQCTPEQIAIQVDNATDAKAADALKSALEKDLHGAMMHEAARGRVQALAKKNADLLKALPKDIDAMSKKNPRLACFDSVMMSNVSGMTRIAVETALSLNVMLTATTKKK
ncbi:MAG TPA: hypothetical protein VGH28_16885 [Polyangiaceae bacterium]